MVLRNAVLTLCLVLSVIPAAEASRGRNGNGSGELVIVWDGSNDVVPQNGSSGETATLASLGLVHVRDFAAIVSHEVQQPLVPTTRPHSISARLILSSDAFLTLCNPPTGTAPNFCNNYAELNYVLSFRSIEKLVDNVGDYIRWVQVVYIDMVPGEAEDVWRLSSSGQAMLEQVIEHAGAANVRIGFDVGLQQPFEWDLTIHQGLGYWRSTVVDVNAPVPLAPSQHGNMIGGGPSATNISCLEIDPLNNSRLYACVDPVAADIVSAATAQTLKYGLYRSLDGGTTWSPIAGGLPAGRIAAVAIDPINSDVVYAATEKQIYRSANAGSTWAQVFEVSSLYTARDVAVDPATSAVYAAFDGQLWVSSTGAAGTWADVSIPWSSDDPIRTLTFSNALVPVLFVDFIRQINESHPLYWTEDAFVWTSMQPPSASGGNTLLLEVDRQAPSRVYVSRNGQMYLTTTFGSTWQSLGRSSEVVALRRNPIGSAAVRMYYGTSAGVTAHALDGSALDATVLQTGDPVHLLRHARSSDALFAAAGGRLWRSLNSGVSWTSLTAGFPAGPVADLEFGPGVTVLAATATGAAWKSADLGVTWSPIALNDRIVRLSVDPQDRSRWTAVFSGSIWPMLTTDGGSTWRGVFIFPDISNARATWVVFDPFTRGRMYAFGDGRMHISIDGGESWAAGAQTGLTLHEPFFTDQPNVFYAAGSSSSFTGLWKTTNGGVTFTPTTLALSEAASAIGTFVAGPAASALLVGSGGSLHRSIDGGATWTRLPVAGATRITSMAVAPMVPTSGPGDPPAVYIGTSIGLFRTTDQGGSVSYLLPLQQGGRPHTTITGILARVNGSAHELLLATGAGVWRWNVSLQPDAAAFGHTGGSGVVTAFGINAPTSNAAWIAVEGSSSINGYYHVRYRVQENLTASARTGSITLPGFAPSPSRVLTITQSAACGITLGSSSASVSGSGASGTFSVSAPSGCPWVVTSNHGFITVTTAATGSGPATIGYSVAANGTASPRQGTISIGGQVFTISQSACSYALVPSTATVAASGGANNFSLTAGASCPWTVAANQSFITVISPASGAGPTTVSYVVAANHGTSARNGTIIAAGQTFTVVQAAAPATVQLDRAVLQMAATTTGISLGTRTPAQRVRVNQAGAGSVTWTATSEHPWVTLTPASGVGGSATDIDIVFHPALTGGGLFTTAVTFAISGASPSTLTLPVTLDVRHAGTTTAPFGSFDTPADQAAVAGSIAVTGWALDDIGIDRVEIWRDRVAGETTPVYTGGGPGNGKIFIGRGLFVEGAREDVRATHSSRPMASRAGWGYLLLTQGLWNRGNGTYVLHAFAFDVEGNSTSLGARTISVNNAGATRPFGAIDTPGYGATVGESGWNFGWALSPGSTCSIAGGSVEVSIDSGPLQPVTFGALRSDIAGAFPDHADTHGAGGSFWLDISGLADGMHSIGWLVRDGCGRADGVGSRFFFVERTASGAASAAVPVEMPDGNSAVVRAPADEPALVVSADTDVVIRLGERLVVDVPGSGYSAALRRGEASEPLPVGASFDAPRGRFYWQPGPAFRGRFEIVFTHPIAGTTIVLTVTVVLPDERASGR